MTSFNIDISPNKIKFKGLLGNYSLDKITITL